MSTPSGGEISLQSLQYSNGMGAQVMDIVDIPMVSRVPLQHQPENQLVVASSRWTKVGNIHWGDLQRLEDFPDSLWVNGDSSGGGVNDRMTPSIAHQLNSSLTLIRPQKVTIQVFTSFGKKKVRAEFEYRGSRYNLKVTDLVS